MPDHQHRARNVPISDRLINDGVDGPELHHGFRRRLCLTRDVLRDLIRRCGLQAIALERNYAIARTSDAVIERCFS